MRLIKRVVPLTLILFAFWFLLTAKVTLWSLVGGLVVSLVLALLASYVIPTHFEGNLNPGFSLRLPVFFALLLWEIIKANWDVFKRVVRPRLDIDPRVVEFDSYLESNAARTVLAGAINLTPGTVTLEIDGNRFFVHCLAEAHDSDLAEGKLERMVAWLFKEGPVDSRRLT
ncbi:MAG: Na+/H+ antiporter subunit E [Candidatus Geothermincolia bacterium]